MAWGGERGVVVVDVVARAAVCALAAAALYQPDRNTRADRQRSPSLDQPEEARPSASPAASPAEPAAAPEEPAATAPAPDKLDARRKSTPWKTFNLKRQLSKVDLKFKAAFAVPAENDLEEAATEAGNSQFYCEASQRPEAAQEALPDATDSPEEEAKPAAAEVEEETERSGDGSRLASPLRVCSDVFERMHRELHEKRQADVYDRMHRELHERWQEAEAAAAAEAGRAGRAPRPDSLPLSDEGPPARPPRARPRARRDEERRDQERRDQERRDQRLLSVPNIKYKPEAVRDLRRKHSANPQGSFAGSLMRRFRELVARLCNRNEPTDGELRAHEEAIPPPRTVDKLDSSFSRSRSSSMSSLENISQEGIQCLAFADSYIKKSAPTTLLPTLWIGTTQGSVLTMMINLPEADLRHTQPVGITTSGGPIFRLKGSILTMSFLDCNGALIPYSYECWKDDSNNVRERRERTPTKQSSSSSGSRMSPTPGTGGAGGGEAAGDRQFVVIASEKQARVVALPSQNCVYRQQIVDTDFVVKAEIVSLKDSVCLVNYLSTGHLVAYSLPSLRPLVDVDFLPLPELRIAKTFCFSNKGHGLYLASPTEIQKFTIDAEFCQQLNEMLGELFLPRDMPEPPKESFFRGLFGGGSRPLDREELFGESSGLKPNRAVAKHIPGPNAALENLGTRASTAASEVSRAHMLVLERGDKLSQLEDRTERMSNQAAEFSTSAHQLMLKYKDKKWYQL